MRVRVKVRVRVRVRVRAKVGVRVKVTAHRVRVRSPKGYHLRAGSPLIGLGLGLRLDRRAQLTAAIVPAAPVDRTVVLSGEIDAAAALAPPR